MYGQLLYFSKVWINRVWLPILFVVSWKWKSNFSLPRFAPENLVSRDRFSRRVPRQTRSSSAPRMNLVLTPEIPPAFRDDVLRYTLHTNSGCGKKRRILIGPWWPAKVAPCQGSTRLKLPRGLLALCRRTLGSERHSVRNCVTR